MSWLDSIANPLVADLFDKVRQSHTGFITAEFFRLWIDGAAACAGGH